MNSEFYDIIAILISECEGASICIVGRISPAADLFQWENKGGTPIHAPRQHIGRYNTPSLGEAL